MKFHFLVATALVLTFAASPVSAQSDQYERHKDRHEDTHQVTPSNPPDRPSSNQGDNAQSHFSDWQHRDVQSRRDTQGRNQSYDNDRHERDYDRSYDRDRHDHSRSFEGEQARGNYERRDRNRYDNNHSFSSDRSRYDYDRNRGYDQHDNDRDRRDQYSSWNRRNAHPDFRRHNVYAQRHYRYHGGRWYWPRGYSYQRWTFGMTLPSIFWAQEYWIADYYDYGLAPPPPGCVWVRYGDDAILIDEYSGEILEVVYDQFY